MEATQINRALHRHFANYDYLLDNTFIFPWESDFFCRSKAGYVVECEVKVTRSDFQRDFEKEKHNVFRAVHEKRTHYIRRDGQGQGDIIGRVRTGKLVTEYGPFSRDNYYRHRRGPHPNPDHWDYDWRRGKYVVNDYGHVQLRWREEWVYSRANLISIRLVEKLLAPHQFYFAVPEGLIQVKELPPYAGLLYVSDRGVELVKKAPYMHKRPMDLTAILLKKYYNLWLYKVGWEAKNQIRESYLENNS